MESFSLPPPLISRLIFPATSKTEDFSVILNVHKEQIKALICEKKLSICLRAIDFNES